MKRTPRRRRATPDGDHGGRDPPLTSAKVMATPPSINAIAVTRRARSLDRLIFRLRRAGSTV